MLLIIAYLGAVVLANLGAAWLGPAVTSLLAFLFIGLDLVARDGLHERWGARGGQELRVKMGALIVAGSLVSWALNAGAGRVAVASLVAFGLAGLVDTVAYQVLREKARLIRVNGSNVPAALVDSLVFPSLAFSQWLPGIVILQFAAKVFGGALWSVLLRWKVDSWA